MGNITIIEHLYLVDIFIDPITDNIRLVFQVLCYVILAGVISLFGVGANLVNISVFVRQGFKDSINISLMGLAISDLACCSTLFVTSSFYNPLIHRICYSFEPMDVSYITVAWPRVCASRITSFITAFITLERCLCIAMPLKVKTIITPFRTKVIIVSIFISVMAMFCPFFFVNKLEWKFVISRNKSTLGLTFTKDRKIVDSVTSFMHGVFLSTVLFLTVVVCTIVLVVKLNKKTKWRTSSVAQTLAMKESISIKEKKVIKMITLISTIFIVCYIPTTMAMFAMVICPEFNIGGRYENTLYTSWSLPFVLDAVNSSVNIFVYFNMSTKYRETFQQMFNRLSKTVDTTKET